MKKNILHYIKLILALVLFLQVGKGSAQTITVTGGQSNAIAAGYITTPCGTVTGATVGAAGLNNLAAITLTSDVFVTSMSFLIAALDNGETATFDAQGITNEVLSVPSGCTSSYSSTGNVLTSSVAGGVTRVTVSSVTPFKIVVISQATSGAILYVSNSAQGTAACTAGTTAPTLSKNTIGITCPTTVESVDLNSLVTSSLPTGASLKWYKEATHTTEVTTPTAVTTSGTYYAFYVDTVNNCYSPASAAVTATVTFCTVKIENTCPGPAEVDLATKVAASNVIPSGYTITYHSGTPATTANKLTSTVVNTLGTTTYYAAYFYAGSNCYTPTRPLEVKLTQCCAAQTSPNLTN